MMKHLKHLLIILTIIFSLPVVVLAKNQVTILSSKKDLKSGDEVLITAKLESDSNLYALMGTLSYDEKVFERIDEKSFSLKDNWSDITYNANNQKFGLINKSSEITENFLSVNLRVKEDAQVGNTTISLSNISASDGKDKIYMANASLEVLVSKEANGNEAIVTKEEDSEDISSKDEIITTSNRPFFVGLIVITCLLAIALVVINVTKINNKKIINIVLGILLSFSFIAICGFYVLKENRKDVNHDGQKDYLDAKEIIKYLIDCEGTKTEDEEKDEEVLDSSSNTSEYNNSNSSSVNNNSNDNSSHHPGDFNNDGKVDIVDVAGSVSDTTNKNYQVVLTEVKTNQVYYSKESVVPLTFSAQVNPKETISEVVVDGIVYPAIKNATTYTVNLVAPKEFGVHEFKLTKVILSNKKEVKTLLKTTIEVLKNPPSISNFMVDEETGEVKYLLNDEDKSSSSSKIKVTDYNDVTILEESIELGENSFIYNFSKDKPYHVLITSSYDLDTNLLNNLTGNQNEYVDETILDKEIMIASVYNFTLSEVKITDSIVLGDEAIITFKSTNQTKYIPEKALIDNKEYPISKISDDTYQITLPKSSMYGKYTVKMDAIILSNGAVFKNGEDYEVSPLSYSVLKNSPTITDLVLMEDKMQGTINVSYALNDIDNTVTDLVAVIMDSNGNVLEEKEALKEKYLEFSYENNGSVKYTVKFLATYDLGLDGYNYTRKSIKEEDIYLESSIYFTSAKTNKIYVNKDEEIYVYYDVFVPKDFKPCSYPVNISNLITGVTINGLTYSATRNRVNGEVASYTVNFKAPKKSGVVNILGNRFNFYDGTTYFVKPMPLTIEVLKSKPEVKNFTIVKEDYENGRVTFSFDIIDDLGGFDSGEAILGEQKALVTRGSNTITFENISKDAPLTLTILGNYDLDTNTLDNDSNYHENEEIFKTNYSLYNPNLYQNAYLSNIQVTSSKNNQYFEKDENINIGFTLEGTNLDLNIQNVVVLDKMYPVKKDKDKYFITIDGFKNSGVKNFIINEIILDNGKKLFLKDPAYVKLEVLKSPLTMDNFNYHFNDKDITISMQLNDKDSSLTDDVTIKITDENDNLIKEIKYNNKEITFEKKDGILRYYVSAYANYDLDTNTLSKDDNKFTNEKILDEVISLDNNYLEMKDITDVSLYKNINGNSTLVDKVSYQDIVKNKNDYFVSISMSNSPAIFSKIKEVIVENNHLILLLDYKYAVSYSNLEEKNLQIDFGVISDGYVTNEARPESFIDLIQRIKDNPSGVITLNHDYDASSIESLTSTFTDIDFTGELDGNNHVIKNLSKPLFKSLNKATVKNLKFINVLLPATNANGTLAISAKDSEISNILIEGFEKTNSDNTVGAILGSANNTTIKTSKVSGLLINNGIYNSSIGGLVGALSNNSLIENSYVTGLISGGYQHLGGIAGQIDNKSTIQNCYTKVTINNSFGYANYINTGGIVGSLNGTIKNNVSLSTGEYGYKLAQLNNGSTSINNYQMKESNYTSNSGPSFIDFSKDDVDKELFTDLALFDEAIWSFKNVSYDNLPTLNIEFNSGLNEVSKENDLYDSQKEILYYNLHLLTPFFDSNKVILNAQNISNDHILNKQKIKHIIPVDNKGELVTYLTNTDYKKIAKIKLILEDDTYLELNVRFDKIYDMVVGYRIPDLKIDYTYNHYMLDSNSKLIDNLVEYLSNLDYTKDLDVLTSTSDSRLYRDYYNEVVRKDLREFVLKYLSNSDSNITLNDSSISNYIEKDLKYNDKLKKVLYVYNYFQRWYSVKIDNIMFSDLIFFNSKGFNDFLTPDNISNLYLNNESNFNTGATNDAYKRNLEKYTNISNIPLLLEYFVNTLTNDTPDVWFAKSFKGILKEVGVDNRSDITYTMWSHLRYQDNTKWTVWHNYALVLLTLPENSTYIISSPTQYLIGSQRTYIVNPFNKEDKDKLTGMIDEYARKIGNYYTTASGYITEAKYYNQIHTITVDNRFTLDSNGKSFYQSKLVTEEAFHKNFNEAVNLWKEMDGNAATSNGTVVFFNAYTALSAYPTWSHENAHNIDSRLFLKNNGRRYDAGGEDYSDGNLAQRWGEGEINVNLTEYYSSDVNLATNWTPTRVNSPQKIESFYRKVFESIYLLDYLEAQAFLQLSSEEQASIATQVYYPKENEADEKIRYKFTGYKQISAEEIEKMNLESINDLYDNKIIIYPGVKSPVEYGDNKYGSETIFKTRWYQPYNNFGRPDSYTLKFMAFEMLGYAGYDNGYIEYYSNIHNNNGVKTDLMALQTITKNPNITFDDYRKGRFEEVKNKLQYVQYLNVNDVVKDFYYALSLDAKNNDRDLKNRKVVRREAYMTLKRATNDFEGEIYNKDNPQKVEDFKILEN